MSRETKFGYGFLLLGAAVPSLIDRLLGPITALVVLGVFAAVGIGLLITAHLNREGHEHNVSRRGIMGTIGIFVLVGALLGGLAGSAWLFIQHYREGRPGPGPVMGPSDAVSTVVTPSSPKGGAMTGSFRTSGRGEYEVDILGVAPDELLFEPPGKTVDRKQLPTALIIDGHRMCIRNFTPKGFIIFHNGWRDVSVTVRVIKASM